MFLDLSLRLQPSWWIGVRWDGYYDDIEQENIAVLDIGLTAVHFRIMWTAELPLPVRLMWSRIKVGWIQFRRQHFAELQADREAFYMRDLPAGKPYTPGKEEIEKNKKAVAEIIAARSR